VYEVKIKGQLRVRIHGGILFVYSPKFPTSAAAGKSRRRRRRLFVRALRGGRAAQRLASANVLCYLSVWQLELSAFVATDGLKKSMRRDKSTSTLHFSLQQGTIASGALLDIVFALFDAYLVRRWANWFYIKSTDLM
jgi:hypothetical protein